MRIPISWQNKIVTYQTYVFHFSVDGVNFRYRGQVTRARVILALREYIWNASAVLLVLPAFDFIDSLGYPSRRWVYLLSVSTLVTASRFLAGNSEAELNSTNFSTLLFCIVLSFFFSYPPIPQRYSALKTAC